MPDPSPKKCLPDPPSHFSIDSDLADELLKLSFKDRVAIQEEIHGVRCLAVEETPELIERSLRQFDNKIMERKLEIELSLRNSQQSPDQNLLRNVQSIASQRLNIKSVVSPLLLSSASRNHTQSVTTVTVTTDSTNQVCYLNDPNIRLRFLRCEYFDVSKAVQRLVRFLELTCEVFGDFVAERPIQIDDFNTRKEEVALYNSRNQYLPFRDRSGRRIFVGVGHCDFESSIPPELRCKMTMFLHWVVSEDIETQQKGVVIVAWPSDEAEGNENETTYSWEKSIRPNIQLKHRSFQKKVYESMPVRTSSQQGYFKDTPFFRALSVMYYLGMNQKEKRIYKAHYGESGRDAVCTMRFCTMRFTMRFSSLPFLFHCEILTLIFLLLELSL